MAAGERRKASQRPGDPADDRFVNRDDTSATRRVTATLSSRNQAKASVVP
jgi:hypothetical protein